MKAKYKITGSFNTSRIYAEANEPLKLISNRDGTLIVENESGEKFAATPDEVTEDKTIITLDDAPGTASTNKIPNRVSVAKTKAKPINHQSRKKSLEVQNSGPENSR